MEWEKENKDGRPAPRSIFTVPLLRIEGVHPNRRLLLPSPEIHLHQQGRCPPVMKDIHRSLVLRRNIFQVLLPRPLKDRSGYKEPIHNQQYWIDLINFW